jgi:hypothetical protein
MPKHIQVRNSRFNHPEKVVHAFNKNLYGYRTSFDDVFVCADDVKRIRTRSEYSRIVFAQEQVAWANVRHILQR